MGAELAGRVRGGMVRVTLIYLVNGDMVLTKRPYTLPQEIQAEYVGYRSSVMSLTYEEVWRGRSTPL